MKKRGPFSTDVDKYYSIILGENRNICGKLKIWLINYGFHCLQCYRFGQAADAFFVRHRVIGFFPLVFHRIWNQRIITRHHVEIDRRATIGRGFFIMHYLGICIGPVTIGENCVIHHNVTIGQRIASGNQGVPAIGNNVWIGPGAIIYGAITVGDNCAISAGSILSRDVPANSLVGGNPGRVILQDYDNSPMINYRICGASAASGSGPGQSTIGSDALYPP